MNLIDLNLISEIILEMENNSQVNSPFTIEEKLSATEQIIHSYHDTKSRIPEIRQNLIEEKIKLSKYTKDNNFSNVIKDLDASIKTINSYEDDEIYVLYMLEKSTENFVRINMKIEQLKQNLLSLQKKLLGNNDFKRLFEINAEVDNSIKELNIKLKEGHIARIIKYYFDQISIRWLTKIGNENG